MYTLYQVLVLITALLRGYSIPNNQAGIMAQAISEAAQTREEAAMLITVSLFETGFRSQGRVIPFGMSARPSLCRTSLTTCAQGSLRILHNGQRNCGHDMRHVFGFYHTGRCVVDSYSIREYRTYQNVYRSLGGVNNGQHNEQ